MDKHSILFIVPQLTHGGSNQSLQSIFAAFPDNDWALFNMDVSKEYSPYQAVFSSKLQKQGRLYRLCCGRVIVRKVLNAMQNYLHINLWSAVYAIEAHRLQRITKCTIAVGFEESYATLFASHFRGVRKIAWMHCDYDLYKIYSGGRNEHSLYEKFDSIVAVSKFAKDVFVRNFPEVSNKTRVIYNLLDINRIKIKAQETIEDIYFNTEVFTIISVGRISEVKQFQKIPDFIQQIKSLKPDFKFKWYIIGDGDYALKKEIERKRVKFSIQKELVLLGSKDNPYPYIAQANLLACTSRTESWSYVINEAIILQTPVVTIRCGSSEEVVVQGVTGFITMEQDLHSLLIELIEDKDQIYSRIQQSVKDFSYDNDSIIEDLKDCFSYGQ